MTKEAQQLQVGDVVLESIGGVLFVYEVASILNQENRTTALVAGGDGELSYIYTCNHQLEVYENSQHIRSTHGQLFLGGRPGHGRN